MQTERRDMRHFLTIVSIIVSVLIIAIVTYTTTTGVATLARNRERAKNAVLAEAESIINITMFQSQNRPRDPASTARAMALFVPEMLQTYQQGDPSMVYDLLVDVFAPLYGISMQVITMDGQAVRSSLPEGVTPEDLPAPVEGERFQAVDQIGPLQGHYIAWYIPLTIPVTEQQVTVTWIIDRTEEINRVESNYANDMSSLIIREVSVGGGILILSLIIVLWGVRLLSKKYIIAPMNSMQEKLVRSERLGVLGELAGSVSHELRNPLNVIKSSTFYLRNRLGDTDEKVVTHLDRVERNVERADNIINDLLSFSRTTSPNVQETDPRRLVEAVLAELKVPAGVNVAIESPPDLPELMTDAELFGQLLNNVLLNSFQAMPKGGAVEIELAAEGEYLKMAVRDEGTGISAENLPKVFEPLFSTKAVGTGFGLAVCRRIVEQQGGTIGIESEEGIGTLVTIRLPLRTGE